MSEQNNEQKPVSQERPKSGPGGGPGGGAAMRPAEKAKDFKKTLRRLTEYLAPEKTKFILVALLAVFSSAFSVVGPKLMGMATTKLSEGVIEKYRHIMQAQAAYSQNLPPTLKNALTNPPVAKIDFGYIGRILLIMVGLYVISALCSFVMGILMSDVAQKTVYQLRNDIKNKLDTLPLKYFDTHTHGEILSRVTNDMDNIATTLQQSLTQLITSIITIIGVLVMMLSISPAMTIIALFTLPASAILTMVIAKNSQRFFIGQQKEIGLLNGHVEEMFSGHKIVKAYGRERSSIETFEEINDRLYNSAWKAQFMSGMMMPALNFVNNIGYVLVCVLGGLFVASGKITIGDIQSFIQYMRQFTQPVIQTANIANVIQSTIASAERVFEVLDEQEQVREAEPGITLENPQGDVTFSHVRFGYSDDKILINDLSIEVKAGQTVAIVGPTGAGKTTVVNLLLRFYELNGGEILIDGENITDMKRAGLRGMFGMVLQDTWLFSGTIADNIAYGKENVTREEVVNAAKSAYVDRFIRTLPNGYDTELNEEASNISQGQKQLLTIARAILYDPAILILDEATSSVDTRTELLIQKAMGNLMAGRTSFVIAHRLSTIKNADVILVMQKGDIIEQGTHDELIAAKGFYEDLYNSQFAKASGGLEDNVG